MHQDTRFHGVKEVFVNQFVNEASENIWCKTRRIALKLMI